MTDEELIKINEALIAKYGVAEATTIFVKLVQKLNGNTPNPILHPGVPWNKDDLRIRYGVWDSDQVLTGKLDTGREK